LALFLSFAKDFDKQRVELKVANDQLGHLISAGAGVVEKQQESIVSSSLRGLLIGRCQKRIHLSSIEIWDQALGRLFEWNSADLAAPHYVFWTMLAHKAGERVERGQSLITSCD
jgi:hypothetical protein